MEGVGNTFAVNTAIVFSVFFGTALFTLFYIVNVLKTKQSKDTKQKYAWIKDNNKKNNTVLAAKTNNKVGEGRWAGPSEDQEYTKSWMLTSIKGHTSQVLNMDYEKNEKYLASSAEEDLDAGENASGSSSISSSDSNQDTSSISSESPTPMKGLSRRQRKNRKRNDHSPSDSKKKNKGRRPAVQSSSKAGEHIPLKQYTKLNLAEVDSALYLRSYVLSLQQLQSMGYPLHDLRRPGYATIFKSPVPRISQRYQANNCAHSESSSNFSKKEGSEYRLDHLDESRDSGQGSESCSDSSENADSAEYVDSESNSVLPEPSRKEDEIKGSSTHSRLCLVHTCVRCRETFLVGENGDYITQQSCHYHWAKLEDNFVTVSGRVVFTKRFGCCKDKPGSRGCTYGKYHVWNGVKDGYNTPKDRYVCTQPRTFPPGDGNFGAYAMDCEMCYTSSGLEVTKITVVALDGQLVYDTFVRPDRKIVDYNTRFSGITVDDLNKKGAVKTLREVQHDLMSFISAETILVGHGLENDLRALRMIHHTVVDTAMAFPHFSGPPYRRSLKSLVSFFLKKEIQKGTKGHSSYEDACACMELMLWRIRKDFGSIIEYH